MISCSGIIDVICSPPHSFPSIPSLELFFKKKKKTKCFILSKKYEESSHLTNLMFGARRSSLNPFSSEQVFPLYCLSLVNTSVTEPQHEKVSEQ